MLISTRVLLLAVLFLPPAAAAPLGAEDTAKTPLQSILVLERDSFRAPDEVPFELWLANGSDAEISDLRLHLGGPKFLKLGELGEEKCRLLPDPKRLSLGSLGPQSVRRWPLCLLVEPEVTEGELNLLFTVESRASFVSIEKRVSVGVLGTQTVGGFSLGLVALIVPGLLFLGFLQASEPKLLAPFTAIGQAGFCVLFSLLLVEVSDVLVPPHLAQGMSQIRFLVLCLVAVLLAASIFGLVRLKEWRENQEVARVTSDPNALLAKLMRSRPRDAVSLREEGEEYLGSGIVALGRGLRLLVGWYEIVSEDDKLRERLVDLQVRGKWDELLKLVGDNKLEVAPRHPIKKRGAEGQLEDLDNQYWMKISTGKLTSQSTAKKDEVPADAPLTIV